MKNQVNRLHLCNHCLLSGLKSIAWKKKMKLVARNAKWGMDGINVYIMPKSEEIPTFINDKSNGDWFHKEYFRAWLREVPNSCKC